MIIAELKKKENIVEYILYIRQLMDIMRANGMDMSKIDELLVSKFEVSEKEKLKIHNWYQNLIETMRNEGVTEHGDIKEIKDLMSPQPWTPQSPMFSTTRTNTATTNFTTGQNPTSTNTNACRKVSRTTK